MLFCFVLSFTGLRMIFFPDVWTKYLSQKVLVPEHCKFTKIDIIHLNIPYVQALFISYRPYGLMSIVVCSSVRFAIMPCRN